MYDAQRFESALVDSLSLAQQLSVPLINIHPPTLAVGGRQNVLAGIELIKKIAQETHITIAYEMLVDPDGLADRQDYFRQHQAYLTLEDYVADVKKYSLAATLDTAHLGTWNVEPREFISVLGENLHHVHLSDYSSTIKREHLLLGDGDLDWSTFLRTLQQYFPDITVTVELHPPLTRAEVVRAVKLSRQYVRQALSY